MGFPTNYEKAWNSVNVKIFRLNWNFYLEFSSFFVTTQQHILNVHFLIIGLSFLRMLVKFTKKNTRRKKWSCPNKPPGWKDKRLIVCYVYTDYKCESFHRLVDFMLEFKIVLLWKLRRGWRGLVGFSDFFILKFMVSRIQMQLVIWKLSHERVKAHHTIFVSAPLMTPHFFRPHLFSSGHCSCVLKCIYSNLGIAMLFNMVWFCLKYMFFWKIKGY